MRYLQADYLWLWITIGAVFAVLVAWGVLYIGSKLDKILEELRKH